MKHTLTFFTLLAGLNMYCQLPADSIYTIIKHRSIHADYANWAIIDNVFKNKLQAAKNDIDTIKSFVYVFEQLKDVHSNISYNNRLYGNYPAYDDSTLKKLMPLVAKSQQQNGIIKTMLLQKKYGYIQIPGIQAWGDKVIEYAQAISDSICLLATQKVKGFIIDLRLNSGGQLSSMLSGLNLLIGNIYLGGGVNINGIETNKFEIINNNFTINAVPMTAIKNKCNTNLTNKSVVLLIGPVTISSGSITAIAFKKRPSIIFIGESTADGYTTGNDYFYFGPNLSMNLSTFYNQDRGKTVYKNSVYPDIIIADGNDFDILMKDKKIQRALEWLKNN